jgi:hypothetical protein
MWLPSRRETTLIPNATNAELKSLLQTGLKIFQGHEQHPVASRPSGRWRPVLAVSPGSQGRPADVPPPAASFAMSRTMKAATRSRPSYAAFPSVAPPSSTKAATMAESGPMAATASMHRVHRAVAHKVYGPALEGPRPRDALSLRYVVT